MSNKKVGLVIAFQGTNYGMLLQGYATQQLLEEWGYKTTIIDYERSGMNIIRFDIGLIPYVLDKFIDDVFHKKENRILTQKHLENDEKRKIESELFRNKKLINIKKIRGYKALKEFARSCDSVLIGSDQMWLPGCSLGNYLSLRFVPDYINKISYATSLGVSSYPKYLYHSARNMWGRINHLSVRERHGKEIINTISPNKEVKVVLDPTYLLSKEKWVEKIPEKRILEGKYILCFFLGNNINSLNSVKRYAEYKKIKLVSILSNESICDVDETFCNELIIGASVEEFINLIRGAECVFTDSFHGLTFSVINEKQFYVYYRKRDDAKQSRNSRIDNILSFWEIKNRLITNNEIDWSEYVEIPINYDNVNKILSSARAESCEWLKKALENG